MQLLKINRRNLLKFSGASLLVLAGSGLGPSLTSKRKVFRRTDLLMGSFAEIQLVHDDVKIAHKLIEAAFAEARRIEQLMSRFRKESEIGVINQFARTNAVAVSAETTATIARALHWSAVTEGRFDPAIGHLSNIWNLAGSSLLPDKERLKIMSSQKYYKKVELQKSLEKQTVRFHIPEIQLDLGGIAKGYAVDQAAAVLQNNGVEQALINFGGDLRTLGARESSKSWKIGIRDPYNPDKIAQVLNLRNQAVATSGNYEQFRSSSSGKLLSHHLIDPQTARPGRLQFHGLTVVGSNCRDADALATALFFMNNAESEKLLEDHTAGFRTIRLG